MAFNQYVFSDIVELISEKVKIKDLKKENYISTDNMLPNFGGITPAENLPNSNSCNRFAKKDILFSNIRTYFKKVWLAEFSGGCSPDVLVMRSKNTDILLNEYLFLLIRSDDFINFTVISANGAKMPRGDKNAMKNFLFNIPSIEYQKKCIANYFAFDQKIQLNTQTNQTLEAIAQAIFKSWFVDFDPVRAKAAALSEGKSEHEANLAAMSVICGKDTSELSDTEYKALWQIAEAFPSELVENEQFGEVPKGWEVKKVGEIANFIKGKKPKQISNFQENEMLPHILVASLSGKYSEFAPTEKAVICQNTETLILMDGSGSGKISIGHNGVVGSTLAKLNLNNEKYWAIIHLLLKNKELDIQQHTTGTSIPHTDKTRVLNYNLIIPCDIILNWFNGYLENTLHSILTNRNKNLSLEKIRDELLPKLLSGEI